MSLSERIRPNVEAAQWVVDEVRELEAQKEDWRVYAIEAGAQNARMNILLAASQAREQQLREACACADWNSLDLPEFTRVKLAAALRLPSDTTALEALIQKAGEVMRERGVSVTTKIMTGGLDAYGNASVKGEEV